MQDRDVIRMRELIYTKKALQRILGLSEPVREVYFDEHDVFVKVGEPEPGLRESLLEDMGMYLDMYHDEKSDKGAIIHNLKTIHIELKELEGDE